MGNQLPDCMPAQGWLEIVLVFMILVLIVIILGVLGYAAIQQGFIV